MLCWEYSELAFVEHLPLARHGLTTLLGLSHLILIATFWNKHYHPHFTNEETELRKVKPCALLVKWEFLQSASVSQLHALSCSTAMLPFSANAYHSFNNDLWILSVRSMQSREKVARNKTDLLSAFLMLKLSTCSFYVCMWCILKMFLKVRPKFWKGAFFPET